MMTLDEAIKHAEEVSNSKCNSCGEEHKQLAEWLKELKELKERKEKCKWIKYDYRTMCPEEHDIENPYWRIPETYRDALKYCPYCGKEIDYSDIDNGENEK